MKLTPRMKSWIEKLGVHVAVATKKGFPTVIVTETCTVDGETVHVPLSQSQADQISAIVAENPITAIAPGGLGSVRAPYQFKGDGKISGSELVVTVSQIYCTKPGYEAGIRMDTMGYDDMLAYEEERWKDVDPPGGK